MVDFDIVKARAADVPDKVILDYINSEGLSKDFDIPKAISAKVPESVILDHLSQDNDKSGGFMASVGDTVTRLGNSASDVGKGLLRVPGDTLEAVARTIDNPDTTSGVLDPLIQWNAGKREEYVDAPGADENAGIPGTDHTRRDVRNAMGSAGVSAAVMGGGAIGGLAAATVTGGNPVAAVSGQMAASGAMGYKVDTSMLADQLRAKLSKKYNHPVTDQEYADYKTAVVSSAINKHGLHEAGWEGASNAIELSILKNISGGNIITKSAGAFAKFVATEWLSEAETQIGQGKAENDLGLRADRPMYLSVSDQGQAFKEVALPTFMLGGAAVGAKGAVEGVNRLTTPAMKKAEAEAKEMSDFEAKVKGRDIDPEPESAVEPQVVDAAPVEVAAQPLQEEPPLPEEAQAPPLEQTETLTDLPNIEPEATPEQKYAEYDPGLPPGNNTDHALDQLDSASIVNVGKDKRTILRKAVPGQAVDAKTPEKVILKKVYSTAKGARLALKVRAKKGVLNLEEYGVFPEEGGFRIRSMSQQEKESTLSEQAETGEIDRVKKEAEDIVYADPTYKIVSDLRKNPLNIKALRAEGYDSDTINQISKKFPGILSNTGANTADGVGRLNDMSGDQLIEHLKELEQPTKKINSEIEKTNQQTEAFDEAGNKAIDLEEKGFDAKHEPETIAAGALEKGDKISVTGQDGLPEDIYTVKGEEAGEVILQDGVMKKVDVFDGIEIDGIKKAAGQEKPQQPNKSTKLEDPPALLPEKGSLGKQYKKKKHANLVLAKAVRDKAIKKGEYSIIAGDGAWNIVKTDTITKTTPSVKEIDKAAHEAATSPKNNTPQPTEAMKEAGNYKVGKVKLHGLDISIENPKGSKREGTDKGGKPWSIKMESHYGYVKNSLGPDKDHVDVFMGDKANDESLPVYVVDQVDPKTGKYDEPKVVMGASSETEARKLYLSNYEKGWKGIGAVTPMSLDKFKEWVHDKKKTVKPVGKIKKSLSPTSAETERAKNSAPLQISDFSEKSISITGNPKENKDRVKSVVGKNGKPIRSIWNKKSKSWLFPKAREAEVRAALDDLLNNENVIPKEQSKPAITVKKGNDPVASHGGSTKVEADPANTDSSPSTGRISPDNSEVNTGDVGRELTANKRNNYSKGISWEDIADKEAALKVKEVKKSKVFPRPNYQAMVDGGMVPQVAHVVKQVYDSIAASPSIGITGPTDELLQQYIAAVNDTMGEVISWAESPHATAWVLKMAKQAESRLRRRPSSILSELKAEKEGKTLYDTIFPDGWRKKNETVHLLGGNRFLGATQPGINDIVKAMKEIGMGWPAKIPAWKKRGYTIAHGDDVRISTYAGQDSQNKDYVAVSLNIDKSRIGTEFIKGAKSEEDKKVQAHIKGVHEEIGGKFLLLDKGKNLVSTHATQEDAEKAAEQVTKRKGKKVISEKGIAVEKAERIGEPRRLEGEDVSSEKLMEDFGFSGVNFGNWMKGKTNEAERQLHLNHAYDSFADLADILNVPQKAISLDGLLGIAFGAQGTGSAAAHFVPGVNEINLTRTSGAGSVAHEWAHAVDHYFARQAGLERKPEPFLTHYTGGIRRVEFKGIRPEIVVKFKEIVRVMRKRPITEKEVTLRNAVAKKRSTKNVTGWLSSIRKGFERGTTPETMVQVEGKDVGLLDEFDRLSAKVKAGDVGDGLVSVGSHGSLSPVLVEMRELYKKATGRLYNLKDMEALHSNVNLLQFIESAKDRQENHLTQKVDTDYLKNAIKLESKGGKPYWSTKIEMFARAFDSFVSDTVEAKAAKNSYLSHTGREGETVPMGLDRKKINAAFTELVSEIKTKETDRGVAMYSRKTGLTSKPQKDTINHGKVTLQSEKLRRKLAKDFNLDIPKGTITEVQLRGDNATSGRVPSQDTQNSVPQRRSGRRTLSGAEVAKRIAKLFKKKIVFFKDDFGLNINGAHFSGDTIYINVDANNPYIAITGHELLHSLRKDNPELYDQLYPAIMQEMKVSEFKKYKAWLSSRTIEEGRDVVEDDMVIEEMAANFLGDQMMEPAFWAKVQGHNPSLFQKITSYISKFLNKLKKRMGLRGLRSSEYFRDLGKVQDAMAKAVAGYGRSKENTPVDAAEATKNLSPKYSRPFTGAKNKIEEIIEEAGLSEKFEQVATYLWDKDIAISKVQKELPTQPEARDYNLIRRLMGKRMADETQIFDETRLKPLLKHMADSGLSIQEVEELAYAQHVPERNLQMKRVNARRYIDSILNYMTEAEATEWKNRIMEIDDQFMAEDGSVDMAGKRDAYVGMVDELRDSINDAGDILEKKRTDLSERIWTDKETTNGTPERLQSRLDNDQKRLENRTNIIDKWNDVKDRLSGITNAEADQIVNDWKNKSNFDQNQEAVNELRKIGSDALKMVYDAGELSEDEYNSIKGAYKYHVPLYREDMDSRKASTGRAGAGPLASPIKLASGSTRTVVDIFAHVIDNHQSAISRKHKLDAGKILYNMVKSNPDESRWSIEEQDKIPYMDKEGNIRFYQDQQEDENEVYVKVDGVKHLISVPKDNQVMMRWMEAVKRSPVELGPILKASQKVNRFLAQLNTSFSPEFLITNFLRDIQTAGIHLEDVGTKGTVLSSTKTKSGKITITKTGFKDHQLKIFKNIPAAIKGIFLTENKKDGGEWETWYKDFAANGGKISWMQGYENVQELAKNIEKELAYKAGKHPKKKQFRDLLDFVGATNTAVENGVRLATYRHLVSELGISKRKAAHTVANLTVDFTRHGTAGPVINSLWMFANAGIQGNARMITALARNNKVRKIAGGIVAFGFAANIIGALVGGDDDDGESYYDKLKRAKPSLFERNMIFMIPGTKGDFFPIPMPYGYNLFFIAGNEAASAVRMVNGYSATEGMGRIMGSFLNTFNPIGAATVLQTLSPTVTDPIVQSMENKAWHGGDLMPAPNPYGQPKPDSERYWKSVNPGAKLAARTLNRITGGNSIEPGVFDISPETIENLVENYTGSLGRFVKDSLSLPFKEDIGVRDIPFMRKLFGSSNNYADSKIYRINRDKVDIVRRKIKAAATMKERSEIRRNSMAGMVLATKSVEKKLKRLRKSLTYAEDRKDKARAELIKDMILQNQRSYNKRFNKTVYQ